MRISEVPEFPSEDLSKQGCCQTKQNRPGIELQKMPEEDKKRNRHVYIEKPGHRKSPSARAQEAERQVEKETEKHQFDDPVALSLPPSN